MAHVLFPLPVRDFDPSEAAVSWKVLTRLGHRVSFATPAGEPSQADDIMLSGRGLDPWSRIPGLGGVRLVGLVLRANSDARSAYAEMTNDSAYRQPLRWEAARCEDFDGLLLAGGHRARGMRAYIDSPVLQALVAEFFHGARPVAAICHGVLLAARSTAASGASVLHGRRTTALLRGQELLAWRLTRARLGNYYRTYPTTVEDEVIGVLARAQDFEHGPTRFTRDSPGRLDGFVVVDGRYVSSRWPGDAHTFAHAFASVLAAL
jgi:putative intracellular protease/amidase